MSPSIIDGLRTSSQALEENSRETTSIIAAEKPAGKIVVGDTIRTATTYDTCHNRWYHY